MSVRDHWRSVYATKSPDAVSWFRPHLDVSLSLVRGLGLARDASILDVGRRCLDVRGRSLGRRFTRVTVLDLADDALAATKARLGERASSVGFVAGDVTSVELDPESVDLWHDRAVFHFLTDADAQAAYVRALARALRPGGHAIVATFAPDGPERCSGLPVVRRSPDEIAAALGPGVRLVESRMEAHVTPWGSSQSFAYALVRRV
jgi:SAM-dependent methyltransferase